jgi:hypothetical protein
VVIIKETSGNGIPAPQCVKHDGSPNRLGRSISIGEVSC